jgi:hypothetical protein
LLRAQGFLLAHRFDDHPLSPATVELGVENLLPGAEVQFSPGDRHPNLVVDQKGF